MEYRNPHDEAEFSKIQDSPINGNNILVPTNIVNINIYLWRLFWKIEWDAFDQTLYNFITI